MTKTTRVRNLRTEETWLFVNKESLTENMIHAIMYYLDKVMQIKNSAVRSEISARYAIGVGVRPLTGVTFGYCIELGFWAEEE
ncbi:MAG: hypothetical protein EOP49_02305 [Sphingobacteriales bacterium]|nr:MAG: hypothetical protein EOP49_02305 [Sphingobacteriales bacterium]